MSTYELSKHPLHLLMKPIQVGFFLFGAFIISWCNTATSFECSWIWIRMHACVMQHRQSVPFYAAIKEKKTCVSRTFCEMWGFMGFSIFSVSAWWHDLWTLEWHSLPMRAALYSACPSRCLSTLIWLFCWDWTWSDGWSNDSSGQDTAALTLPPPLPSLWTPKFWGVLRWYLGVWTFLRLVLWKG